MKIKEALIRKLYDLEHTQAKEYLQGFDYPWQALSGIKSFILKLGESLDPNEYDHPSEDVWIHKTARVFPSAYIAGPCIIGAETEVRHCAFIRGSVLVGKNCVVGNSTELKNVILFDNVQVPHYNYVGDSILGFRSHMGAGSITSNVKSDKTNIVIHFDDEETETGIHKAGAFLGNFVEIGCGTVLNPGTVIGAHSNVYPLSSVRKPVSAGSIYKKAEEVTLKRTETEI